MLNLFAVGEGSTVPVKFPDEEKIYVIQWEELLTINNEIPFEALSELRVGVPVRAPWTDAGGEIQYADAVVVEAEDVKGI